MSSLFDWSSTASSNTTCDGIGTNTGMSPANVDNVFRSIMALVRNTFASALQSFLAGTAALPIANGGTAATDATTALSNLGGLEDDYRDLVRVDKSADFTFAASERGYGIGLGSGTPKTATINPQSTTAIGNGATYVLYNFGAGTYTIARGAGVSLYKNGSITSADAAIAPGGVATVTHWYLDVWTINGVGVS